MDIYRYNRFCCCTRCRCHCIMGPVVLITLGVLFLLDSLNFRHMDFSHNTWPLLIIAIGIVMFAKRSASIDGHLSLEPPTMPFTPAPQPQNPSNEVHNG